MYFYRPVKTFASDTPRVFLNLFWEHSESVALRQIMSDDTDSSY